MVELVLAANDDGSGAAFGIGMIVFSFISAARSRPASRQYPYPPQYQQYPNQTQ